MVSNVVFSQIAAHQPYGGVVPELASREHLKAIVPVVRKALADAGQTYQSIDALAVTQGPGLAGALLVGIRYAKALAFALDKPLIAVNHLEGHIHAVLLEERQKGTPKKQSGDEFSVLAWWFPAVTRIFTWRSSGTNSWSYRNIGHTRDDAAGEAFDKVAKLLGLGYPGGPIIDKLAAHGDPAAVKFAALAAQASRSERQGEAKSRQPRFDFSYSGIKTAVLRYVETHDMPRSIDARRQGPAGARKTHQLEDYLSQCDKQTLDLVASFQRAMVRIWSARLWLRHALVMPPSLFVTGGVAANNELRQRFEQDAAMEGLPVYFPSRPLSTDNAAMIAAAAYPKFLAKDFAPMDFSAEAGMVLR